ncbi:hypothetical protein ACF0H5_003183 [Mactra antiquata]
MDKLSRELQETDQRVRVNRDTEVQRIQKCIEKTVLTIFKRVKDIDNRLSLRLRKVGSYYDGLKIGLPDEFDFLAEIDNLSEGTNVVVRSTGFNGTKNLWKTPNGQPGRRKLQYVGTELHDMERKDDDYNWLKQTGTKRNPEYLIDCISVKNTFYFAVLQVVKSFTAEDLPRYLSVGEEPTFMHGPAVTLEFIWNGRAYKNLVISVDLTVCIKLNDWKKCFDTFEWMVEDSSIWTTLQNALDVYGYHLTPYISDRGHSCQWRVSTSFTEHLLMDSFSCESKLKTAIRCLKYQRDRLIANIPDTTDMTDQNFANVIRFVRFYSGADEEQQLVSSYMIKTTALVTLGLLSKKLYVQIPLSVLYSYFIIRLYTLIKYGELRMFFISDYKLRVPAFGDILPGFKDLVYSINEEDIPVIEKKLSKGDNSKTYNEDELEFNETRYVFTKMKADVTRHYEVCWRGEIDFVPNLHSEILMPSK